MREAIIAALVVAVLGGLGLGTYDPPSNLIEGGAPDVEPVAQMPAESIPEPEAVDAYESEPEPSYDPEWYEPEYEAEWYEPEPYSEPELVYTSEGETPDLYTMGVVSDGERTYTWYSSRTLPGGGLHDLNANGRTTNDEGFVTDGEGYIAIASPDESISIGTVIDTPWGQSKVYDYNPGDSWDVYTCWE